METASLKAFATSARTELIREVTARITAVLGQGSPERVESPTTVAGLEKAVAAGGGGDKGKAHVADKVAYTWFNRIIALRFMDANGYTGIGVVSPAADQVGQPEVLAAAKRGQIDKEVVSNDHTMAAIAGLLNGTQQPRLGVDAQAEAYSLLLAAYCRFWHKAMPFMFERQGDFTELLIPANLLAGDSALNRSVEVLTEDACKDVEVIGWLYQFYISERKDEVFAGFKKNKKAGADEIPAATQLFTPHWIVRYLVENSLGRLWMLNRPTSGLVHQMDYYIAPVDEQTAFLKIAQPEELKVIDPACGSGHMLTYAFDLLYAIYEEEGYAPSEIPGLILANNLYGVEIDPRAGALAGFALAMKARARQRTFFGKSIQPNICVLAPIRFTPEELDFLLTATGDREEEVGYWNQFEHADTFGSLIRPTSNLTTRLAQHIEQLPDGGDMYKADAIESANRVVMQAEYLTKRYHVVVANPPYMGNRNMSARLADFGGENFPDSKSDLFSMFVERCEGMCKTGGQMGFMSPFVWMFISSYEPMRRRLTENATITGLIQLEYSGFEGATVPICCFTVEMAALPNYMGAYIRLADFVGPQFQQPKALEAIQSPHVDWFYRASSNDFKYIPGRPIAYWLPPKLLEILRKQKTLQEISPPRQGIATADNARFLRLWWEVSECRIGLGYHNELEAHESHRKWFPYNKGGEFRRWYGNQDFVINWQNGGEEIKNFVDSNGRQRSAVRNPRFQFRPAVSWSLISSGLPAFRYFPPGFLFDVAGMSLFGETKQEERQHLGLLNSVVATEVLKAYAPTMNFQVGDISRLPMPNSMLAESNDKVVMELVDLSKSDWDESEISWSFVGSPLLNNHAIMSVAVDTYREKCVERVARMRVLEEMNNRNYLSSFGLEGEFPSDVLVARVSLDSNLAFRYRSSENVDLAQLGRAEEMRRFVSYVVGCAFGRYSLDQPGLILADQGSTLRDYLTKVSTPTSTPDDDNVIPIVDGDWFEDDIVGRFRQFLRVALGAKHFEENLNFVIESLGVKSLREYFITKAGKSKFYDDHVQRYKKRPIYWLFSSPKGSFNALIYLHRYTPSTASTVLTYLREYVTKLESSLQHAERAGNAKEADRLRKILVELNEYEHDTLYPKASENVAIDLDDGVKVNYPKLGGALRKIAGLESSGD